MTSPEPVLPADAGDLLVSIVVIGRNEGIRIAQCLESVQAMVRDNFTIELIYVDSGSVDASVALAAERGASVIALKPKHPTAALGRNTGWRAANGSVILFLDGDTILHPRFVADCLAEFRVPEVAVVWGHRRELYPERSLYNRILDLDWIYRPGPTPYCGGDALFRRSVLERTGGFDEKLIAGEEPELCWRIAALGFVILHVDHPMTGHDLASTRWRQYWKRATRAGHAYAEVADRFRATSQPLWSEESRRNRNRALLILAACLGGFFGSILLASLLPTALVCALFVTLAIRSAWRARWKTSDPITLSLYGAHSLIEQIPIYCGQLQYWWNRRRGKRSTLLEYKEM
jgi:cellulose synthase/poly-beta-1,6-N-acetylglucosamine synthase-like glycosyltransferase